MQSRILPVLRSIFLPLAMIIFSSEIQAQECGMTGNFQLCRTCTQLEAHIDLEKPDAGDYFHGAEWNGLYSAYVLNCPVVGAKLLRAGANPSSGGTLGSMILTVSSKWPHNNRKINESWAALLLTAGASMSQKLDWSEGKNTSEILADEPWYKPDYSDLYVLFQH